MTSAPVRRSDRYVLDHLRECSERLATHLRGGPRSLFESDQLRAASEHLLDRTGAACELLSSGMRAGRPEAGWDELIQAAAQVRRDVGWLDAGDLLPHLERVLRLGPIARAELEGWPLRRHFVTLPPARRLDSVREGRSLLAGLLRLERVSTVRAFPPELEENLPGQDLVLVAGFRGRPPGGALRRLGRDLSGRLDCQVAVLPEPGSEPAFWSLYLHRVWATAVPL
jgi:hypothetical protein